MKQASSGRRTLLLAAALGGAVLLAGCNCEQQVQTLEAQNQALASRIIELENEVQRTEAVAAQARAAARPQAAPTPAQPAAPTAPAERPQEPAIQTQLPEGGAETRTYIVAEGDNLWNIARRELGRGIRYREILTLNPGISENEVLKVGTRLVLPPE